MIVYNFEERSGKPLYEYLYECIRRDILSGRIAANAKLPSKREMARDNGISVRTVMNAYDQLLTEGYIQSVEKKGYFAANVQQMQTRSDNVQPPEIPQIYKEDQWLIDFTSNNTVYDRFPFSMWKKVMRETLSEYDMELVKRGHFQGILELRKALAKYLYRTRGMHVSPECIVIGAGIEYLYGRLIKLLPEQAKYAVENPGYKKIPKIYEEYGLNWSYVEMDEEGISLESLKKSGSDVIHVSPEHHYPLGTVMTTVRRQSLLSWAQEQPGRYLIEDDYDCEFRYRTRSIPALQSMDVSGRVIYMNTFSKTLTPAIRISYMVLPEALMKQYVETANFYTNTVSSYEQYALAKFIEEGYFERHLSRMKKFYRTEGERLMRMIRQSVMLPVEKIIGGDSGTHLLVKVDTSLSDQEIKEAAREQGINVACLSEFCTEILPEYRHMLVLNYSDTDEKTLREAVRRLGNIFTQW